MCFLFSNFYGFIKSNFGFAKMFVCLKKLITKCAAYLQRRLPHLLCSDPAQIMMKKLCFFSERIFPLHGNATHIGHDEKCSFIFSTKGYWQLTDLHNGLDDIMYRTIVLENNLIWKNENGEQWAGQQREASSVESGENWIKYARNLRYKKVGLKIVEMRMAFVLPLFRSDSEMRFW